MADNQIQDEIWTYYIKITINQLKTTDGIFTIEAPASLL